MILADGYPATLTAVSAEIFSTAKAKGLRLYVEFPAAVPGLTIGAGALTAKRVIKWEKGQH